MKFKLVNLKSGVSLYHTATKVGSNEWDYLVDSWENRYRPPAGQFSDDLVDEKFFGVRPEFASYWCNDDEHVQLEYKTKAELVLLDLRGAEKIEGENWLRPHLGSEPNEYAVSTIQRDHEYFFEHFQGELPKYDGWICVDDSLDNFCTVCLIEPSRVLDPGYTILDKESLPNIDGHYPADIDNTTIDSYIVASQYVDLTPSTGYGC